MLCITNKSLCKKLGHSTDGSLGFTRVVVDVDNLVLRIRYRCKRCGEEVCVVMPSEEIALTETSRIIKSKSLEQGLEKSDDK